MAAPAVEPLAPPLAVQETEEMKQQVANKNGKKAESSGGSSSFTWIMVLALLGVWTSVAVVYFDLVDYQSVMGKLATYDSDGDGDFDVEDAKILLDQRFPMSNIFRRSERRSLKHIVRPFLRARKAGNLVMPRGLPSRPRGFILRKLLSLSANENPGNVASREAKKENLLTKDVGWKLREALKQQLALIHERVEAKKIAKLALAEVRSILAKEEADKALGMKSDELAAKARERVEARLKEEEEAMEKEEMEKAEERLLKEAEEREKEWKKAKKGGEKEGKTVEKDNKGGKDGEGEGPKPERDDKGKSKEASKAAKKAKADKSDKGSRK